MVSYKTFIYFHIFDQITSCLLEFSFDHQWNYSPQVFLAGYILTGYYGFKVNILLTFQAVKLSAYPIYQRFELFCKFFGDCWIHLGITSFLKGLVKLIEIGNLEDS